VAQDPVHAVFAVLWDTYCFLDASFVAVIAAPNEDGRRFVHFVGSCINKG
jgi:hypothetical protein